MPDANISTDKVLIWVCAILAGLIGWVFSQMLAGQNVITERHNNLGEKVHYNTGMIEGFEHRIERLEREYDEKN